MPLSIVSLCLYGDQLRPINVQQTQCFNIKFSDHYKIYIKPVLETLEEACLGVWIGPINVSGTCVADDLYLNADTQSKLQAQLDIAENYGLRWRH